MLSVSSIVKYSSIKDVVEVSVELRKKEKKDNGYYF